MADFYQKMAIDLCSGMEDYYVKKEEIIKKYREDGRTGQIEGALKKLKKNYEKTEPDYPRQLCYLTGKYRENYLHDMKICQEYASLNRLTMADIILEKLWGQSVQDFEYFETIHNYIDFRDNVIRKGAISANKDELILIPINMRDGSILARGKGNEDWNNSAPHGAGRVMSRNEARQSLSLDKFKEEMKDVWTTSVNKKTLDENPAAYKSMDEILKNLDETAELIDIIKPLYNYKSS